jgi:hypothetical protein
VAGSTNSTIPAVIEAVDDGPLADVDAFPHGFDGLGVRIGWVPPDTIFDRPVEEVARVIEEMTKYNSGIVAAIAAGDAQRTLAASDAKAKVVRQIGNSTVRIIVATGFMAISFWAVARSFHLHVTWGLAGVLFPLSVGAASLPLRWIIARRARSTAEPLPPPEQPEQVDQP